MFSFSCFLFWDGSIPLLDGDDMLVIVHQARFGGDEATLAPFEIKDTNGGVRQVEHMAKIDEGQIH